MSERGTCSYGKWKRKERRREGKGGRNCGFEGGRETLRLKVRHGGSPLDRSNRHLWAGGV